MSVSATGGAGQDPMVTGDLGSAPDAFNANMNIDLRGLTTPESVDQMATQIAYQSGQPVDSVKTAILEAKENGQEEFRMTIYVRSPNQPAPPAPGMESGIGESKVNGWNATAFAAIMHEIVSEYFKDMAKEKEVEGLIQIAMIEVSIDMAATNAENVKEAAKMEAAMYVAAAVAAGVQIGAGVGQMAASSRTGKVRKQAGEKWDAEHPQQSQQLRSAQSNLEKTNAPNDPPGTEPKNGYQRQIEQKQAEIDAIKNPDGRPADQVGVGQDGAAADAQELPPEQQQRVDQLEAEISTLKDQQAKDTETLTKLGSQRAAFAEAEVTTYNSQVQAMTQNIVGGMGTLAENSAKAAITITKGGIEAELEIGRAALQEFQRAQGAAGEAKSKTAQDMDKLMQLVDAVSRASVQMGAGARG